MFDRAKLALKACTPFPSIQQIEFVFREMFVCISKGNFSPFGVLQRAPIDADILGVSLIEVPFLYNGPALFSDRIVRPRGPIHPYDLHSAGSFSSCPLIPFCASRSSSFVEPFPLTDAKLHISHSLSQYKRTRKGIGRRTERNTSILLGLYSGLSLEHKG